MTARVEGRLDEEEDAEDAEAEAEADEEEEEEEEEEGARCKILAESLTWSRRRNRLLAIAVGWRDIRCVKEVVAGSNESRGRGSDMVPEGNALGGRWLRCQRRG